MSRSFRRALVVFALVALLLPVTTADQLAAPTHKGPGPSSVSLLSRFARENGIEGAIDLAKLEAQIARFESSDVELSAFQANADWNSRPQNETAIAIRPGTFGPEATWVIGANDYGIGAPIGGGVYTSAGVNYFPPFPLLIAKSGNDAALPPFNVIEPPIGTGDPVVVYGTVRPAPGIPAALVGKPIAYYSSLAFSTDYCENGIIVMRSFNNGTTWNRPVAPPFVPPKGIGFVVYHDEATNCNVFHDKEWMTVDNTSGPHKGRVYVTWTQFRFSAARYMESPIMMAWSDNNGLTFSDPVEVSGFSLELCPNQFHGQRGECDENQFSVPVVLPGGMVAIAFENEQGTGFDQGFRDQYLVTILDPDSGSLSGPFKVADLFDGLNDYPISRDSRRQTLCNSNFRVNSAGNLTADSAGNLYLTYSDNKKHQGEFPFPTFVLTRTVPYTEASYECPASKATDTDVYVYRSVDGGATWTEITSPTLTSHAKGANDQWFPWIATGPGGHVSVVFYDRSTSLTNKKAHTKLARSADGGATWTVTIVSDFASNFDHAFFGIGTFIGDYNGNAIDGAGFSHPVWTGVALSPFPPLFSKTDSDVFRAVVGP